MEQIEENKEPLLQQFAEIHLEYLGQMDFEYWQKKTC